MKTTIFSWNVNGIRAVIRKDALAPFITKYQPDILCLQETKAKQGQAEIDLPFGDLHAVDSAQGET